MNVSLAKESSAVESHSGLRVLTLDEVASVGGGCMTGLEGPFFGMVWDALKTIASYPMGPHWK
jgi:hypothetical protein